MKDLINMDALQRIHFIGIGGAGMGGIAEVLLNQGYAVTGSDANENEVTNRLKRLGARVAIGHESSNIRNADIIVISSAIPSDNPELLAAKSANIPIVPRAKMLGALMQMRYGIAISGTHGKTTTTSLVASVLAEDGLDPTFVIGGLLKSVGTNAQLGTGRYFVAEADESDASFLFLFPKIAVVTNIDSDHLGTYDGDLSRLRKAFLDFLLHVPEDGLVVLCADDAQTLRLLPDIKAPVVTYGFHERSDIQITHFEQCGLRSHFSVLDKSINQVLDIELNLAGKHNATNALAAIAVAKKVGVKTDSLLKAFKQFLGIGRRFQVHGEFEVSKRRVLLIDDYGHHPREIAVTLEAIRSVWPDRRLVMAYQPHRYTRTRDLMSDFARVLSMPDVLLLLDIYSAGESPIEGINGSVLCNAIRKEGRLEPIFIHHVKQLPVTLDLHLEDGDILLIQGAGNIGSVAAQLAQSKFGAL